MSRIFYRVSSKTIINIANEEYAESKKMERKARALAKKHGFEIKSFCVWKRDGGWELSAFYPKKNQDVDKKIWSRHNRDGYYPKRNTKEGRLIHKEFCLIKWYPEKLREAVGWKDIFHGGYYYSFGFFAKPKEDIWGFTAPLIPKGEAYIPVRGVREVKPSWYAKHFED